MPFERTNCDSCGRSHYGCPECGSEFVTTDPLRAEVPPNEMLVERAEEGEYTYTLVCWDCGWDEKVTITVEREADK